MLDDKSELEPLDQDQPIPFSEIEKSDHDIHEAPERERDSLKPNKNLQTAPGHDAGF